MGTLEHRPTDQKSNVSVVVNFLSQVILQIKSLMYLL